MDYYNALQSAMTIINQLAKDGKEQAQLAQEFRRHWESGDLIAIEWVGDTMVRLARRHP